MCCGRSEERAITKALLSQVDVNTPPMNVPYTFPGPPLYYLALTMFYYHVLLTKIDGNQLRVSYGTSHSFWYARTLSWTLLLPGFSPLHGRVPLEHLPIFQMVFGQGRGCSLPLTEHSTSLITRQPKSIFTLGWPPCLGASGKTSCELSSFHCCCYLHFSHCELPSLQLP